MKTNRQKVESPESKAACLVDRNMRGWAAGYDSYMGQVQRYDASIISHPPVNTGQLVARCHEMPTF